MKTFLTAGLKPMLSLFGMIIFSAFSLSCSGDRLDPDGSRARKEDAKGTRCVLILVALSAATRPTNSALADNYITLAMSCHGNAV
jgi:hypothetical protein